MPDGGAPSGRRHMSTPTQTRRPAGEPGGPAGPGAPSLAGCPPSCSRPSPCARRRARAATCSTALAARGVDARWARWDDPDVDWAAADLVAVRSTWDYHRRLPEFLAWARAVERRTRAAQRRRRLRVERRQGLPRRARRAGPDRAASPGRRRRRCAPGCGRGSTGSAPWWSSRATGASGVGVVVAEEPEDSAPPELDRGPVARPAAGRVGAHARASRRSSCSTAARSRRSTSAPAGDGVPGARAVRRQHPRRPARAGRGARGLAAMAAAAELLGRPLDYGRVDLMELDGRLVVGEVELIEPGLYLDVVPGNAAPFAELVAPPGRLTRRIPVSASNRRRSGGVEGAWGAGGTRGRERSRGVHPVGQRSGRRRCCAPRCW